VVTINKLNDVPPNSLRNQNVGSKSKQWKKNKIKAHFLTHSISKVRGHVGAPRWDQNKLISESSK
jgi:hypothetical protein